MSKTPYYINGDYATVTKVILNFRNKSKQQIQNILLHEQEMFHKEHPDYRYDDYRVEDGRHGERTVFLLFKKV